MNKKQKSEIDIDKEIKFHDENPIILMSLFLYFCQKKFNVLLSTKSFFFIFFFANYQLTCKFVYLVEVKHVERNLHAYGALMIPFNRYFFSIKILKRIEKMKKRTRIDKELLLVVR